MQTLYAPFPPNPVRIFGYSTAISSRPNCLPSYSVTNGGFSPINTAEAAELVPRRDSSDQPKFVIAFYKSYGFDDFHLKRLLVKYPYALAFSIEKTLAPRFRTLGKLGFAGEDLVTLIYSNPTVLNRSMENLVVPKIKLWRSLLGSHSVLVKCLARSNWKIITVSLERTIQNASLLRECRLSDHQISALLRMQPYIVTQKPGLLIELVSRVERLGLRHGSRNFHWALYALSMVNDTNLRAKAELFEGFGWSKDEFEKAFHNSPSFITSSTKLLTEKMEFLLKEASCLASYIAQRPRLLTYSLAKRLVPRVAILKSLKENGLTGGDHELYNPMTFTKNKFYKKYVAPYKAAIPELSHLFDASS